MSSTPDLHLRSSYHYDLPQELIAQHPLEPRDSSRLLVIDRAQGTISHRTFRDLPSYLSKGDSLVFNNTKVIPARLLGTRAGGGKAELMLLRPDAVPGRWWTLAKPGRKLRPGSVVHVAPELNATVIDTDAQGNRLVEFDGDSATLMQRIHQYGQMPLPHYIQRAQADPNDTQRYQTVFAEREGAVAAPTAGLHFTDQMLSDLDAKGVERHHVTLHVGLGTFRPVSADDIRDHAMHSEWAEISEQTARALSARSDDQRQIVVGTTCCRTLESFADGKGGVHAGSQDTDIFLYPGCTFRYVRGLLTNFHLPESTLLMLVCAFGGYELVMEAYRQAVQERYRFFSYGDAMLLL